MYCGVGFSPLYSINWVNFKRNTMQWNIFLLLVTAVRCIFLFALFFLYLLLLWHCCTVKKTRQLDQGIKGISESFYILLIKKKKKKKGPSPGKLLLTRNNPFIWYEACLPVSVEIPSQHQHVSNTKEQGAEMSFWEAD